MLAPGVFRAPWLAYQSTQVSLSKVCPQCGAKYGAESRFCSVDGAALVLEQPADDLVGTIVAERYHILERIGAGGMGEVFLAEHVRMRRKSALKIMREALTNDPIAVSRFHREAENASQISHPNVAAVYDFGETQSGLVYIAMEYIPGEALSDLLERERSLHAARVSDIIGQAADALSAAHALGILHRDLKPDNIMLASTRWGTDLVKLVDFGISRAMASATQQFTSTGMIVGTPDYMSPEQLTGDTLDSRSDQYALGLIAYYALTGYFPFQSGVSKDALLTRLTAAPRKLSETRPDITWPETLQAALDRALALDVNERYAEVHDFGRDFEAAIAEMPGTEEMERYREAQRQRFSTPTRGPSVTPSRPQPSLEMTPATPVAALATPASLQAPPVQAPPRSAEPALGNVKGRPSLARRLTATGAALALVGLVVWQLASGTDSSATPPAQPTAAADTTPITDSAAAAVQAVTATALPPLPVDSVATLMRPGVFTVFGERQQGTAFLVDSIGIVLTPLSLLRGVAEPRIQLEPERHVIGRVMAVDSARGVAALRIPVQHCRRCPVLPLVSDTTSKLSVGDSLAVAAAVGRGAAIDSRGTVSSADGRTATIRLASSGGPVLIDRGVIGMALRRSANQATVVSAQALASLRSSALRRRAQVLPNDSLVPAWPARPVPPGDLERAIGRSLTETYAYKVSSDGIAVFVMTPQIMAWRQREIARQIEGQRLMSLSDSTPRLVDPIQFWSGWDTYRNERRAVVVLHISSDQAQHGEVLGRRIVDFKHGDVAGVLLYRNNVIVQPIEFRRIPAVVNHEAYRAQNRFVPMSAIAVYRPRDLAAGADLRLEVVDARRRNQTIKLALPDAVLSAIQQDLASYLR